MPTSRRKITAVTREFETEINRLRVFDSHNQSAFASTTKGRLTKKQYHLLVESVFFAAFRAYEKFIKEVFLLYCLEKPVSPRSRLASYIKPMNYEHAESLIRSSARFLDWTSPDNVISRAELYLKNGYPIKIPYTTKRIALQEYKHIRNQIAHSSKEALVDYKKVLRTYFGVIPVTIPQPGEFLMKLDKSDPTKYLLISYFDLIIELSEDIVK